MSRIVKHALVWVFILTMLSGCALFKKLGFGGDSDELQPVSSIAIGENEAKILTEKLPVSLYFANEDNTRLKKEIRYVPRSEGLKSVDDLASLIMEELIKGPSPESGLKPTIPKGTKLRSKVSVDIGKATATVDLSKEFADNHPGDKNAERMTIYSIVNSLSEIKEIQGVKFLIEGKSRAEYKGGFQFDGVFPRTESLIDKSSLPVTSGLEKDSKGTEGDSGSVETADEWIGDVEETFGHEWYEEEE